MRINKDDYQSITELIRGFLEEIELVPLDELPACRELEAKLKRAGFGDNAVLSQMLVDEKENECAVFVFYNSEKTVDDLLDEVMQKPLDKDEPMTVHIVVLTSSVEELLELEKRKGDIVKKLGKWAAKCGGGKKKASIKFYTMHAPRRTEKSFSIDINSRICGLHHASKHTFDNGNHITVEADLYIANLYDIVEMYNKTGAELFDRNVRYHIKDVFNVESEIQKTLLNNPSQFFAFNNGISVQVGTAEKLDRRSERRIRLTYEGKGDVSVINGAQTISAAAEFFFQPLGDSEQDREIKKAIQSAREEAQVLLRVIYPREGASVDCLEVFEQISISLNRQKPINPMDVQYACQEVMQINTLYEKNRDNPFYFRLMKRGQAEPGRFQYQLSEIGRLVRTYYYDEPGKARTMSTQEIIRYIKPEDRKVGTQDKGTIYAPFDKDQDNEAIFMQWYKPVNFASRIAKIYSAVEKDCRKREDVGDNVKTVLANGRYFFTAYAVRVLSGVQDRKKPDFSEFAYGAEAAKRVDAALVLRFAHQVADFAGEETLNSNTFKTEDFYTRWCAHSDEARVQWEENLRAVLDAAPVVTHS